MSTQPVSVRLPQEHERSSNTAIATARYVCFGTFHLDLKEEELFKNGTRVKLRGKVYQTLLALLQKPGEVVTREELRLRLWPSDTHVNYDANVNTTVNKLRQVLGDSPEQPAFVETIPRKGYTFVAKVEYVDRSATLQAPPQPARLLPVAAAQEHGEGRDSFFRMAMHSKWFTAGVVVLVIVSMMFGAALVLYAHH